ncbi:Acetylxylan esterase [Durusdinium trenchii]
MTLDGPAKGKLRTGQRVVLQGLSTSELNGHRGIIVRWRQDCGRYAVRVAGKELGLKPENLTPEGGAAVAQQLAKKLSHKVGEGSMINPEAYARVPGAGPKMTQWVGQVKAGRRVVVRADVEADAEAVPLWFGDLGFVQSAPVDVALLLEDVGDVEQWPKALERCLKRFPTAAGRLRQVKKDGQLSWKIFLNNAGVPFTAASVPPCGLPTPEVLQLACQDDQCGFFDTGLAENGEEDPLLRLKLIHEEGTAKGLLGISFHHVLFDIFGLTALLRELMAALQDTSVSAEPCHARQAAQEAFEAQVPEEVPALWPLWPRSSERWCFLARRLRSGLRGRPDGVATLSFAAKREESPPEGATQLEALVASVAWRLRQLGRGGRVMVTKDYRAQLEAAAQQGLERLVANCVTHGLSFALPDATMESMSTWSAEACVTMRKAIDQVSLGYVKWHSEQDHFRGLPNIFGGFCVNSWGHALCGLENVEAYAVGMRSIDERAAKMCFPLDAAYMQVLPQKNGLQRILLTMPVTEIEAFLKDLPAESFEVPHISEMRTHSFRVPLPPSVMERLNPAVQTHHIVARVACVGDSLTACGYPKYLQALFDRANMNVQVRGFGVCGATAQKFSDQPYWEDRKLEEARVWRPHFVVVLFGTNDAKPENWDAEAFQQDYRDLCVHFLERQEPRPELLLATPPPAYSDDLVDTEVVNSKLPSLVPVIAEKARGVINAPLEEQAKRSRSSVPAEFLAKASVVDTFSALGGASLQRRGYFSDDGIHPNERGTRLLALVVFADLRAKVSKYLRKRADEAAREVPDNPLGL